MKFLFFMRRYRPDAAASLTLWSIPVLISMMRESPRKHTRSWHARPGSYRPIPVRHDPIVNADMDGPGETGERLSRAGLRLRTRLLLIISTVASLCFTAAPAAAQAADPGPWVGLAGGRMGNVQWSVKIARPAGSAGAGREGAQRPCLQ